MAQISLLPGERLDDLQIQGLRIIQRPDQFCFGIDAVLLSWFAQVRPGERVVDLGTGNGILPLLLCAKSRAAHIIGLEIQQEIAQRALRSVQLNGLEDRICIVQGDLRQAETLVSGQAFEVVVANPPYLRIGTGQMSGADARAIARHEICCTIQDVAMAASTILKMGGRLYMVHLCERMSEVCCALSERRLEPKRICLVHPYPGKAPNLMLIEAVKDAQPGIKWMAPLVVREEKNGPYTQQINEIYGRGERQS